MEGNGSSKLENTDDGKRPEDLLLSAQNQFLKLQSLCSETETYFGNLKTGTEQIYSGIEELKSEGLVLLQAIQNSKTQSEEKYQELEQVYEKAKTVLAEKNKNIDSLNSEFDKRITEYTTRANEKHEALTKEQEKLATKTESLTALYEEAVEIKKKIVTLQEEALALKSSVETDITNIKDSNAKFQALLKESTTLHEKVTTTHADLEKLLKDSTTNYKEISTLHGKLLTGEKDSDGKEITKSISAEIDNLYAAQKEKHVEMLKHISASKSEIDKYLSSSKEELQGFISSSTTKYQQLCSSLESEIRSLLPGAGAAGLAYAFVEAKSRYGGVHYDKKPISCTPYPLINSALSDLDKALHVIKGEFPNLIYYIMFLGPIIYSYFYFSELFAIKNITVETFIFKAMLAFPLGLISWFGFCSIRINRKLFEEYNHKQRVMQLYHSFKEEIDKHGSEEQQKALIAMMISVVQDKPSVAIHKYEEGMEDTLKKIMSADFSKGNSATNT